MGPRIAGVTVLSATHRSRVRRLKKRGSHDRELVHRVLDEGFVCHVGFVVDGEPYVLPTAYGRDGDTLYLHGAAASRMLQVLGSGARACVTVTLIDGLVLARSAFHHSMNYRSVVLFGPAREVTDPSEKARALDAIVDHIVPGRTAHARAPNAAELAGTKVVALAIDEGSAKLREGPPIDDAEDMTHPAWAGVIPFRHVPDEPVPEQHGATPEHVWRRSLPRTQPFEERRGELVLSSDPARIDVDRVHDYLARESYWSRGVSRDRLERSLRGSMVVGVYDGSAQVGFARLVTDRATFAHLCDVFVLEPYRGRGIARWMIGYFRGRPELQGLRRWLLGTVDAHGLYEKLGFSRLAHPERMMEIHRAYDG
jgi:nitroimidazol reductase NimA-like FMN-containing flavoprotein (pyridoxamine 5'-phosphate oxidase superfamily)/GNAT superfamily N-acetyltransferase